MFYLANSSVNIGNAVATNISVRKRSCRKETLGIRLLIFIYLFYTMLVILKY